MLELQSWRKFTLKMLYLISCFITRVLYYKSYLVFLSLSWPHPNQKVKNISYYFVIYFAQNQQKFIIFVKLVLISKPAIEEQRVARHAALAQQ